MSQHVIVVQDLVKTYQRRGQAPLRAVDGLSFTVAAGSIFGLLGPNGAGKTTTLRILTTLRAADVRARDGPRVRRRPRAARGPAPHLGRDPGDGRRAVSLRPRQPRSPSRRFHGLLGAAVRAPRGRRARALRAGGRTPTRRCMDLSGGFRRRVQVAKMFMVDTPVVFLDEFSTGMDPLLKRAVMELLRARGGARPDDRADDADPERGRGALRRHPHHEPRPPGGARRPARAEAAARSGVYEVTLTFDRLPDGLEAEMRAVRAAPRRASARTPSSVRSRSEESRVLDSSRALARARTRAAGRDRRRQPRGRLHRADRQKREDGVDERARRGDVPRGQDPGDERDVHLLGPVLPARPTCWCSASASTRARLHGRRHTASTTTRSSWPACSAWRASASRRTPRGRSSWTATTASSTRCSPTR